MGTNLPWYQRPEMGRWLHIGGTTLAILLGFAVGFIADPSNPLGWSAGAISAFTLIANEVITELRNSGMVTVDAIAVVQTGAGAADKVIIPTAGK